MSIDSSRPDLSAKKPEQSMGLLRAIDELEHLVESSTSVPLSKHKIIDEDTFFVLTTRLKSVLPEAIKEAAKAARLQRPVSSRLRHDETTLLIVDVQEKLLPAMHEGEHIEKNCVLLTRAARQLQLPIVVTEQYPERLGPTVAPVREVLRDESAPVTPISKMLFSACTDATLSTLREANRPSILLCGIEAHVCVLQSTLDLLEQGFTVFVSYDAVASRHEVNKQIGWERMLRAGAIPTSTESAVFELLREAGTPDFKALLPFMK